MIWEQKQLNVERTNEHVDRAVTYTHARYECSDETDFIPKIKRSRRF